jgi:hypothetical protein
MGEVGMKNEGLEMMAKIADYWLMTNTNLDVEKVIDFKEFILKLGESPMLTLENGEVIDVNSRYIPEEYKVTIEVEDD